MPARSGQGGPTQARTRFNAPIPAPALSSSVGRRYRGDLVPAPSLLRPCCAAVDRLRLWFPAPRWADMPQGYTPTSPEDATRVLDLLSSAWRPGTRSGYGSGLLAFHVFCDQKVPPVPECQRGPASDLLILEFIAACAGSYRGQTLSNYAYGVKAWHTVHGLGWILDDTRLNAALVAAERVAPPSLKRPERPPLLLATMEEIGRRLDLSRPLDAAVYACLTTTFWSASRLGEFTLPSLSTKFDPKVHVSPADVSFRVSVGGLPTTKIHLPSTKVAPEHGEDVHWAPQDRCDPDAAFKNHLAVNSPPANGPLFAYIHTDGRRRSLTRFAFLKRINSVMTGVEGWLRMQGHSIRIGSVLEYLLRGVAFEVVKVIGRWSSDAFLRYLRKHGDILAPYIQSWPALEEAWHCAVPPVRR